jgi:uncharacterized protein (DUF2249 family)
MVAVTLDNRGLQPPEPMVRILEALQALPDGDKLEVMMDREPVLLYPELERRGFAWTFNQPGMLLVVCRATSV